MSIFDYFLTKASTGGGAVGAFGSGRSARNQLAAGGEQKLRELVAMSLTPRQRKLNEFWAWYQAVNYDVLEYEWDGSMANPAEVDLAAFRVGAQGSMSYWSGSDVPVRFRKPSGPVRLPRAVVNRFTGLLFGDGHAPTFTCDRAPELADLANRLAEQTRLWNRFDMARTYGGAQGSAAVSFRLLDGTVRVEAHDPRWCFPVFADRETLRLESLEKRYAYPQDEWDPNTQSYGQVWYWYRRVIDARADTVYEPIKLGTETDVGALLTGERGWVPKYVAQHDYGFCPVVWIQNTDCTEGIDGEPDFWGAYQLMREYDAVRSQARRGVMANCDPTLLVKSEQPPNAGVKRGSAGGNALHLSGMGDDARYLEMNGAGTRAATEEVALSRSEILESVECVLTDPGTGGAMTATEVNRRYAAMLSKASRLREQYGERGVLPLMTMILRAVAVHQARGEAVVLPARAVDDDSNPDTPKKIVVDWKLPPAAEVGVGMALKWGPFFEPTTLDAQQAVTTAGAGVTAGILSRERAVAYIAPFVGVDDPEAELARIQAEREAEQTRLDQAAMLAASLDAAARGGAGEPPDDDDDAGAGPNDDGAQDDKDSDAG